MFQSAVSWMVNPVMLTKSFEQTVERRGNTHQFFAPVSVYPTRNGFVYVAVGNDKQWESVTATREFAALARDEYTRNAGRIAAVTELNDALGTITREKTTQEWIVFFNALGVPVSPVKTIREVIEDPHVFRTMLTAHDSRTGTTIHLPAPAVIPNFLRDAGFQMRFPPRLGEDNAKIYSALGFDVAGLKARGTI
jgi:crotonobetainyl-CoA:carnitine CoA-transferase CaiB-like acyl-CoA transferase